MVNDVFEAMARLLVVIGLFLLFGPWGLVGGAAALVAEAEWRGRR